jgi:2-succinyl-5-enolpyruvyl-6-hydroxy-3-cyclohexene-1-carboxylate synthase
MKEMDSGMDTVEKYVGSFVDGLYEGGVRNVVICPGSRSTPLAIDFSRRSNIVTWILYDERSAGFFALGVAKSSSAPVALVCTSGTAAANFLPAIVESKFSRVPLVVITADRPPELRDFGGNQTIDQIRLYGSHVKWFQDMPTVAAFGDSLSLLRYSRLVGLRASSMAGSSPVGPIHINFSFREPLLSEVPMLAPKESQDSNQGFVANVKRFPSIDDIKSALKNIKNGSRGIIVAGPGDYGEAKRELFNLSKILGWPILADSLSNLRQDSPTFGLVRGYTFLLRNKTFCGSKVPEWVIRLGDVPTSKELTTLFNGVSTILLDDGEGWRDPTFSVSKMILGDLKVSLSLINQTMKNFRKPANWLSAWIDEDNIIQRRTDSLLEAISEPFEGKLFHHLSKVLRPSYPLTVFVGNSMTVRDLDFFFLNGSKKICFAANRGANGIDGLVSTAMGVSAIEGNVLLILGDVSFYYDMNGLLASKLYGLRATVIIINNKGAGIFSFLTQHSLPGEIFEKLFGEGHDIDFSGAKTLYGGEFYRVADWQAFDQSLSNSIDSPGLKIIEFAALDRERNLSLHRKTIDDISSQVVS